MHVIDGTYEFFRHYYAVAAAAGMNGLEVGAVRGVLTSVLSMIERGATHLGCDRSRCRVVFGTSLSRIQDERR